MAASVEAVENSVGGWGMRSTWKRIGLGSALAAAALVAVSCNSVNRETAPVQLLVTNTQFVNQIDLAGGVGCDQDVATVELRSVLLQDQVNNQVNLPTDNRLNDIVVDRYKVSYIRTDGGTALPASFVRSISTTVFAGGTADIFTRFLVFEPDAVRQAPFAALLPVNGNRDPETGKSFIKMDVILEIFGTTLAGERVSGSTRIPLTFCYSCNGCL
jgi:hypothetical protein